MSQYRPGPEGSHEPRVGQVPGILSWHDIEDRKAINPGRMVKRKTICNATATVMPGDTEVLESEACHHSDHVPRHRTLRVRLVIGCRSRTAALSIAAQVGANHGEAARQQGRHPPPHQVGLWETVKKQDRRPGTTPADENAGFTGLHLSLRELILHESLMAI